MAKRFGKKAVVEVAAEEVEVEVEEVEVEEVEVEEVEEVETPAQVIAKSKKVGVPAVKGKPAPVAEVEEAEVEEAEVGEEKAKGAPRARKWNYGIQPEAKIFRMKGAECPKGVAAQWGYATSGSTVQAFYEAGGDRHGLRVMMRGKAIVLKSAAGQFPQAYDHEAAAEAAAARAAARAAKAAAEAAAAEDEADEAEEVEPTPAPTKKAASKVAQVQAPVIKKKK